MSVSVASKQLCRISERKKVSQDETDVAASRILNGDTLSIGLARVGSNSQCIKSCTLAHMSHVDLGPPLHSLIIPGDLHPLESQMLEALKLNKGPE